MWFSQFLVFYFQDFKVFKTLLCSSMLCSLFTALQLTLALPVAIVPTYFVFVFILFHFLLYQGEFLGVIYVELVDPICSC